MNKLLKFSLLISMFLNISLLMAEDGVKKRDRSKSVKDAVSNFATTQDKEVSIVDNFKKMFSDGKVSGQLRSIYAGYNQKKSDEVDTYATAVGGYLKYELAQYNGFNSGITFRTSNDLAFGTGSRVDGKNNDELSSSTGNYTEVTQAYINYKYKELNLRAGRQALDTPLADSDDIRMIANSFEAYVATYIIEDIEFMAGNIQSWQGYDAGLDNGWSKVGDDGAWFGGLNYAKNLEVDAWFYNIINSINAAYFDVGYKYSINKEIQIHGALQYLHESELNNSGYEADIYGLVTEFVVYGVGLNIAYNKADKKVGKKSFSGTGGGTIYTSMDSMIIDNITQDRDASATVVGLAYDINDWKFLYAYGSFVGDENSAGIKEHIVEHNIGLEYEVNKEFFLGAIYVVEEDIESSVTTTNDWNRMQLMIAYNF